MKKDCCNAPTEAGCSVVVRVDVTKIVGFMCIAGVLIVGIIFGTRCVNTQTKYSCQREKN